MLFDGLGDDDRHLPHCEAEIEVRLETQAAVAPPLRLAFASVAEFALWLKASRLSVDEFRRLPVYEWHRDQLEPLVRAGLTMLTTRRMTSGIAISLDRRRERWLTMRTTWRTPSLFRTSRRTHAPNV